MTKNASPVDLHNEMLPPREILHDGSASIDSYKSVGESFFALFTQYLPLTPQSHILEVGSCVGRMARQFVNFLSPQGSFTGFDILRPQVEWCQQHISTRFSHFSFFHADVINNGYNPGGTYKTSEYRFPAKDNSIDAVLLTSVFTHMLLPDIIHYIKEIHRVLKPGGSCFATFFMFAENEVDAINSEKAHLTFPFPFFLPNHSVPVGAYHSEDPPEFAVCYNKKLIVELHNQQGLRIRHDLPGTWLTRTCEQTSYQDILISQKP